MPSHTRKTPADPNLALRIEVAMWRNGITAEVLAERLGLTRTAPLQWVSGKKEPSRARIPAIAEALGVTVAWLMGEDQTDPELERRFLRYQLALLKEGGTELADLLEDTPPAELAALLRARRPATE